MSELLHRSGSFEVEDGAISKDGRTLRLRLLPFDLPAIVHERGETYREGFRRGAFAHLLAAANRVELRYEHQQADLPYGFGTELVEDASALVGSFRSADSERGRHLLALVEDGLRGVSVGFFPDKRADEHSAGVVWRRRVKALKEVSLTTAPIYAEAEVLAVRHQLELDAARERARWDLAKLRAMR